MKKTGMLIKALKQQVDEEMTTLEFFQNLQFQRGKQLKYALQSQTELIYGMQELQKRKLKELKDGFQDLKSLIGASDAMALNGTTVN